MDINPHGSSIQLDDARRVYTELFLGVLHYAKTNHDSRSPSNRFVALREDVNYVCLSRRNAVAHIVGFKSVSSHDVGGAPFGFALAFAISNPFMFIAQGKQKGRDGERTERETRGRKTGERKIYT